MLMQRLLKGRFAFNKHLGQLFISKSLQGHHFNTKTELTSIDFENVMSISINVDLPLGTPFSSGLWDRER